VRASATSRTNSPANIPASQAKTDANKADAASPFALLVEMATAKDPAKPAKKDAKDSGDKPADNKPAVKQEDNAGAAQTASPAKPAASARSGKPDKNKDDTAAETDKGETDRAAADDRQVACVEQQMAGQQALPSSPVVEASIAASAVSGTDTDAEDDIPIAGTSPLEAAASSSTDTPQSDPLAANSEAAAANQTQAAAQTAIAAQSDDQAGDSETPQTVTASSAGAQAISADAKPPVAAKDTAKAAAAKIAANSEPASTAQSEAASIERAKYDLAKSDSNKTDAAKDGDNAGRDTAKDGDATAASLKNRTAHAGIASNDSAKAAAGTSDVQKADAPQPDTRPTNVDNAIASADAKPAPQPAFQPATASNGIFAINNIAAPQAIQNSQAPIATQHLQVTAQTAPNLPALAVEIAAKSQSGAKQFDIRLDPPELGRVEVRLSIDATGKASAHLSADQPQTLALLQKDAPLLTRALREAGLDVSQDGLNFSLRQQAHDQGGSDSNNRNFGNSRAFSLAATASIDPTASTIAYRGLVDGRLDIRV
jgi:flagellar hook-length control protein FliK